MSVPRNDLEDDCIGVYKPMFQDLAYSARKHPDKLVFGLFPRSFTEKCFDGKPFISDSHTPAVEGTKVKPQSNKGTYKHTPDSYGAARMQMMCLVNDQGEVMNIVLDLLVVVPQKRPLPAPSSWQMRSIRRSISTRTPPSCWWFRSWPPTRSRGSCCAPSARSSPSSSRTAARPSLSPRTALVMIMSSKDIYLWCGRPLQRRIWPVAAGLWLHRRGGYAR